MLQREPMNTQKDTNEASSSYKALLPSVVEAVKAAGLVLKRRFNEYARPSDRDDLLRRIHENDKASDAVLRPKLLALRPGSQWAEDEEGVGPLPAGEWWVVDAAEGNVNHIHGLTEWGVTATLIADNKPVLAVVYVPLADTVYTAVAGGGAQQDGKSLEVSAKRALNAALVGTGQAKPGEDAKTLRLLGDSVMTMLHHALLVRAAVPTTLTLIHVAAGRMDAYWLYSQVRSGLVAGALLIAEAGGRVTDTSGNAWTLDSKDFVAAGLGVHAELLAALAKV